MSKQKANERINSKMISANDKPKRNKSAMVITVASICILALGITVLYLIFSENSPLNTRETIRQGNTVVTPENIERILAELAETEVTPTGSYEVSMNMSWDFANGAAISSNAYVENAITNNNTVYFVIKLRDDNREIYQSPFMVPGSFINDIRLDENLPAGTYEAILTYNLVDDNMQDVSHVSLAITITIQN